jgi:uncharacterized protein YodC (DUF2158 family)
MGKYIFKDFKIGDEVYHLSSSKLRMVVIEKSEERNEITCRWINKDDNKQTSGFLPEELGKTSDLGPKIYTVPI